MVRQVVTMEGQKC